jgi:hypothetical protein
MNKFRNTIYNKIPQKIQSPVQIALFTFFITCLDYYSYRWIDMNRLSIRNVNIKYNCVIKIK